MRSHESRLLAAARAAEALRGGDGLVVVVSAIGRRGDPYATDTLLDLLGVLPEEADPLSYGLMFATGELIAASLFSQTLNTLGVPSQPFAGSTAGIHTDSNARSATVLSVDSRPIRQCLAKGRVAVVAGGQGQCSWTSDITSLGRGGSDTTAVALAASLDAERLQLFKDVSGIAVVDPQLLPGTPTLREVCYEQLHEMARWGARVISPQAVEIARHSGVRIHIDGLSPSASPGTSVSSAVQTTCWSAVVSTGPIRSVWGSEHTLVGDAAYGRVVASRHGAVSLGVGQLGNFGPTTGQEESLCWVSLLSAVERSSVQQNGVRHVLLESGIRPRLSDERPRRQTYVVECCDERRAAESLYAASALLGEWEADSHATRLETAADVLSQETRDSGVVR